MPDTTRLWAGRILTALAALFLIVDGGMKVMKAPVVLLCTLLYLIPNTSMLGATLLTGYLGGAVATYERVGSPLLRNARLRALVPMTSSSSHALVLFGKL